MASVRIVLRQDKTRKDGKAPLFIRLTHNRKSRYMSLRAPINPAHWLPDLQRVSTAHPFSQRLNALLARKRAEFEKLALDLEAEENPLAQNDLHGLLAGPSAQCFFEVAREQLDQLRQIGKHSTADSYAGTFRQFAAWLTEARNRSVLPLCDFSTQLAQDFKSFLVGTLGNGPNTVKGKFAALRRVMNRALRDGLISEAQNNLRRVVTPRAKSRKRIPSRAEIAQLEALELEPGSLLWDVRNLYLFPCYMAGMRFGDAITLRWSNLQGEHLQWKAGKTGKSRRLFVPDRVRVILDLYRDGSLDMDRFIFPFLRGKEDLRGRSLSKKASSWNSRVNKALKAIGKQANLSRYYSFHSSRHFFATEALRRGVRVEVLQEILMHSSIEQTMEYVHITNSDLDMAMVA